MIIKKLELQGFKSFPERTKIVVHPGITAIIGPNGTGKSNIVDALLWLLGGKRSISLRGERSGDIIFSGNIKRAPLGMADVVLSLADEDEELIINHRVFRSGEGEYRLNGKLVRLKDIQNALWKRAIAEKEYFVIEQGQIGLFLTSKPAEKRLLLEEAAGTAFYKDKKKQAQNKLENSEQNLIRLEDIIAEVSSAKNSLKRQATAAIKYRKLREKIRQLTSFHYRKKLEELEKTEEEILLRCENFLSQEKKNSSKLKAEEKNLAEKRKTVWELEKSIKEEQENLYSLKSQISRLETDREKEAKRIEFFEEKKKTARENRAEYKQESLQLEKEKADAEDNLKILVETLTQKQKTLKKTDQESQTSKEKIITWEKKLEDIRNEYLQKLSQHTETKNEKIKFEKEIELILRQEEKLESQLLKEQDSLQEKEKKLNQNKKEISQTQNSLKEKKEVMRVHQKALNEIQASIETLQNKISELTEKREEETHHLKALEKLEKKERDSDISRDIPGVLGILADFMETKPDYASLVDIFWKEESKSTLIHAKDFMKILDERNIRGNFLLLSPQKKEELPSEVHQDSRVVGFLKSHLRPNPKIKDYFSYFQEAVIVKDVKSSIELWIRFPSLNYITTQGDLLLSSGLLKLGHKKEGIFTLGQEIKKIKENITLIDKKIEPLEFQIKEKLEEKQNLEKQIEKESLLMRQLESKIEEADIENSFDQKDIEKIELNITLFKNELETLLEDKKTWTKKNEAISLKTKSLVLEENELKKRLKEEENEYEAHQKKTEQARKKFFELKSNIDLLEEKIKNTNQQLQTLKRRKEAINIKMDSLQEEIHNCEKEEAQLREKIKNLSTTAKSLKEKEKKRKENQLAQNESYLQQLKEEQEEMEKQITKLREEYEAHKEERVKWEISKAEAVRDIANLEESCWQDLKKTLQEIKGEIPEDKIPHTEIEEKLTEAKEKLQKIKSVNLMAEEEYLIQKKRYDFLLQQKNDLRESIDTTREAIRKIDQESKIQFQKAFKEVNKNFQEVFSLLFSGGTAEVKLADPNHPLESGVDIVAQPPGKKVQNLNLLSGGEKSLTSLAFLFALFRYKPTPFCVLDEVDAALDDTNLARFLELIKKIKEQTQFIIVTHNFKTMEVADYIYGTTMAEPNITSLYSIKLEKEKEKLRGDLKQNDN